MVVYVTELRDVRKTYVFKEILTGPRKSIWRRSDIFGRSIAYNKGGTAIVALYNFCEGFFS